MNVSRLVVFCHVSSEATNGGFPEKKTLSIMGRWAWLVSTITDGLCLFPVAYK